MFYFKKLLISFFLFFSVQSSFAGTEVFNSKRMELKVVCSSTAVLIELRKWSEAIEKNYAGSEKLAYSFDPVKGGGLMIKSTNVKGAQHFIPGQFDCRASVY